MLRVGDDALIRGKGRLADNVRAGDEVYAAFLRPPHPHAAAGCVDRSPLDERGRRTGPAQRLPHLRSRSRSRNGLEGGATQGIGQALLERFVYDRGSGRALTATFMDCALPRAEDLCAFDMTMDESTSCLTHPLDAKGVGELGTIGAAPAVVNAVVDALALDGCARQAQALQVPLTPETAWRAIADEPAADRTPH